MRTRRTPTPTMSNEQKLLRILLRLVDLERRVERLEAAQAATPLTRARTTRRQFTTLTPRSHTS
jgi:hypothetical protein